MPNSAAFRYDDHSRRVIVFGLARHKEEASEASQHQYPHPHTRNPTRLPRSGAFHRACYRELPRILVARTSENAQKAKFAEASFYELL
jgi:hypothetical protein